LKFYMVFKGFLCVWVFEGVFFVVFVVSTKKKKKNMNMHVYV